MPAPILAGLGAAGIAAAVGKSAATVGLSAAGGVASYYIVDAARGKDEPMIGHAILTTASETNSDSLLAVNFGGTESGLVLITALIVIGFKVFKCHNTCHYRCCGGKKKLSSKKIERAALANLANIATALSPHIQKKALVHQGVDKEKQVEEFTRTGRKSPILPTIQEEKDEVTDVECEKRATVAPTHTLPWTTTTNPPPLLPTPTLS